MTVPTLVNELLDKLGGPEKYNLNSILQIDSKSDDQTDTFASSDYYDTDSFVKFCKPSDQKFSTLSLNIECLNAKFDQLTAFIKMLDEENCFIDAILIQETWLTDKQCEKDAIKQFDIPGYHTIPLGRKCGRKGGLLIYLKEIYTYSFCDLPSLITYSSDWEGLFINITHKHNEALPNKITLSNIYRPPRQNNSNASVDSFLNPFSNIFKLLCKENSTMITGGDFNLNLLKLTEREKFQEFFDLFVANGSFPQIAIGLKHNDVTASVKEQSILVDMID